MAERLNRPTRRRRVVLGLLAVAVIAVHLGATRELADHIADVNTAQAMPPRIEVAYVRELELAAPPVMSAPRMAAVAPAAAAPASAAASTPRPAKPRAAPPPEAASEPASEPAQVVAAEPPASSPSEPKPEPEPAAPVSVASAEAPASAASSATEFEWPASTRVSYVLTGNYRGEVQGDAQVEWVRAGNRYQVHLDLTVGPSFAPLITRRMSSDGELGAVGLVPRRYDQETKVVLREPRRVTMQFDDTSVTLANGDRRDTVAGVQDTASQFVQLTYLFTTQPQQLVVGGSFEVPLALPNRVDRWTYDVLNEETIATSFGPLATFHLKPRRESPKPGELSAEIWFAPQLRYLPVRIRIQQDAANYVDLLIARRPQMAAP